MRRLSIKLGAIGVFQTRHMAREFDGGYLHAQADTKVRNFVFTGIAGRANFALNTAHTKAAGHQNAIELGQPRDIVSIEGFRVHILNVDFDMVFHARMAQCFVQ